MALESWRHQIGGAIKLTSGCRKYNMKESQKLVAKSRQKTQVNIGLASDRQMTPTAHYALFLAAVTVVNRE